MRIAKWMFTAIAGLAVVVVGGCETVSSTKAAPKLGKDAPYGAVAFSSSSRNWQIVSDLPTGAKAESASLLGCKTGDCQVLAVFVRGQCASLSLDASGTVTAPFVGIALDGNIAIDNARKACKDVGGRDCKAAPAVCN